MTCLNWSIFTCLVMGVLGKECDISVPSSCPIPGCVCPHLWSCSSCFSECSRSISIPCIHGNCTPNGCRCDDCYTGPNCDVYTQCDDVSNKPHHRSKRETQGTVSLVVNTPSAQLSGKTPVSVGDVVDVDFELENTDSQGAYLSLAIIVDRNTAEETVLAMKPPKRTSTTHCTTCVKTGFACRATKATGLVSSCYYETAFWNARSTMQYKMSFMLVPNNLARKGAEITISFILGGPNGLVYGSQYGSRNYTLITGSGDGGLALPPGSIKFKTIIKPPADMVQDRASMYIVNITLPDEVYDKLSVTFTLEAPKDVCISRVKLDYKGSSWGFIPGRNHLVKNCSQSHNLQYKLHRIRGPKVTEKSVRIDYRIDVFVGPAVHTSSKVTMRVVIKNEETNLYNEVRTVSVRAKKPEAIKKAPPFTGDKGILYSEENGFISQDLQLKLDKTQCGHYQIHTLFPIRRGKPVYSVVDIKPTYPSNIIIGSPSRKPTFVATTNYTKVKDYAYLNMGYLCNPGHIPSNTLMLIYVTVVARVVEKMPAIEEKALFALVYNGTNKVTVGQINIDKLGTAFQLLGSDNSISSRWSSPQTDKYLDWTSTRIVRFYFSVYPGKSMVISQMGVSTHFAANVTVRAVKLAKRGASLYLSWSGDLLTDVSEDKYIKSTKLKLQTFRVPGGGDLVIGNPAPKEKDRWFSKGSQTWVIAYDLHLEFQNEQIRPTEGSSDLQVTVHCKTSTTYVRSYSPALTGDIKFRPLVGYRKTSWMPEPSADYHLSSPDAGTVLGLPVLFHLSLRLQGARRYYLRLHYDTALNVCLVRASYLGVFMPRCSERMIPVDGPDVGGCRSTELDIGLIKPMVYTGDLPVNDPDRTNITLGIYVAFDNNKPPATTKASFRALVYADGVLEFSQEREITTGSGGKSKKIKASDLQYNLTLAYDHVNPGGAVMFYVSLYYPSSSLATTLVRVVADKQTVEGYRVLHTGRNLVCGRRIKREANTLYKKTVGKGARGVVHVGTVYNGDVHSTSNTTKHTDNEVLISGRLTASETGKKGEKISLTLKVTVNGDEASLGTKQLIVNTTQMETISAKVSPLAQTGTATLYRFSHVRQKVDLVMNIPDATTLQLKVVIWVKPQPISDMISVGGFNRPPETVGAVYEQSSVTGQNVYHSKPVVKRTASKKSAWLFTRIEMDFGYVSNIGRQNISGRAPTALDDVISISYVQVTPGGRDNTVETFATEVYVDGNVKQEFEHRAKMQATTVRTPKLLVSITNVNRAKKYVLPKESLDLELVVSHVDLSKGDAVKIRIQIYSSKYLKYNSTLSNVGLVPIIRNRNFGLSIEYSSVGLLSVLSAKFRVIFDPENQSPFKRMEQLHVPMDAVYFASTDVNKMLENYISSFSIAHTLNPKCDKIVFKMASVSKKSCRVESSLRTKQPFWKPLSDYFSFKPPVRGMPFMGEEYIQIDFAKKVNLLEVHTLASYTWNYVTSFRMDCSLDGRAYEAYRDIWEGAVEILKFPPKTKACPERVTLTLIDDLVTCRFVRIIPVTGSFSTLRNITIDVDFTSCPEPEQKDNECLKDDPIDSTHASFYERGYLYLKKYKSLIVCSIPGIGKTPHCALTEQKGKDWYPVDDVVTNVLLDNPDNGTTYGLYHNKRSVLVSKDGGFTWKSTGETMPTTNSSGQSRVIVVPWDDFRGKTPEMLYPTYGIADENGEKLFSVGIDGVYTYEYEWRKILAWGVPTWY